MHGIGDRRGSGRQPTGWEMACGFTVFVFAVAMLIGAMAAAVWAIGRLTG